MISFAIFIPSCLQHVQSRSPLRRLLQASSETPNFPKSNPLLMHAHLENTLAAASWSALQKPMRSAQKEIDHVHSGLDSVRIRRSVIGVANH